MKSIIAVIIGLAGVSASGAAARADDLTPTSYSYVVATNSYGDQLATSDSYALTASLSESLYGSSSTLTINPNVPALEVSGTSSDSGHDFSVDSGDTTGTYAYVNFNYAYQVVGGSGPVPVDVSYSLEAQMTEMNPYDAVVEAVATIQVTQQPFSDAGYQYDTYYNDFAFPGYTAQTVDGTFLTSATPDVANFVYLSVKEQTSGGPSTASTAEAYADPYIYIDPAYLAANPGVTLEISPGVGNIGPTSAAPEPASWALMIVGLGVLGGALRYSRRTASALASS